MRPVCVRVCVCVGVFHSGVCLFSCGPRPDWKASWRHRGREPLHAVCLCACVSCLKLKLCVYIRAGVSCLWLKHSCSAYDQHDTGGVMVCWCDGVLVCWCVSEMVCWCVGVVGCWCGVVVWCGGGVWWCGGVGVWCGVVWCGVLAYMCACDNRSGSGAWLDVASIRSCLRLNSSVGFPKM